MNAVGEKSKLVRLWWIIISLLSLMGLAVSLGLNVIQQDVESFGAVCEVAAGFDCAPALKSRYSSWFGIHLSAYAFAFYALLAAIAIQSVVKERRRDRNALLALSLTGAGSIAVLWLVYVSLFRLRAYCVFCLALHIITPSIFLSAIVVFRRRTSRVSEILADEIGTIRANPVLATGLVLVAVSSMVGLFHYENIAREKMLNQHPVYREILEGIYPRFPGIEDRLKGRSFLGDTAAPVTIVEFIDFTCPICAQASILLDELGKIYNIKRVIIPYPRSKECNSHAESERSGACIGALAAEVAEKNGHFHEFHDAVFADLGLLEKDDQSRLAQLAGVGMISDILADSAAIRAVTDNIELAHAMGVTRVPSLFINGMGIEGLPDPWFMEEVIEREIGRVRAAGNGREKEH